MPSFLVNWAVDKKLGLHSTQTTFLPSMINNQNLRIEEWLRARVMNPYLQPSG